MIFYPETVPVDQTAPVKDWKFKVDHWEVDYDLPEKSVRELYRYTNFNTFEEAAIHCGLLGLKCIACEWLALPPSRSKDGGWCWHICDIPHYGSILVPLDIYDQEKVRIYKAQFKEDYDDYVKSHPGFLTPVEDYRNRV